MTRMGIRSSSQKKRRIGGYDVLLVALGIMGVLSLVFAAAAIPLAATIILLPVGFAMMVLPALATVLVLARLVWAFLPSRMGGFVRGVVALAVTGGLLFAVSQVLNRPLQTRIAALTSADRPLAAPLQKGRTVGVLRPELKTSRKVSQCDQFCQLALLSGDASRVIMLQSPHFTDAPDP